MIQILLTMVFRCPINNKATLVQIMASRQIGDKPLSEPMLTHVCGRSVNGMFLLIDLDKHAVCMSDIISSLNRNGICQCTGVIVFFSTPNHYLNQLWFIINEERTSVEFTSKTSWNWSNLQNKTYGQWLYLKPPVSGNIKSFSMQIFVNSSYWFGVSTWCCLYHR